MKKNKQENKIKNKNSSINLNSGYLDNYKTINLENINLIQSNNEQKLKFLTLSNNIQYRSPLLKKVTKTNNRNINKIQNKYYNLIKHNTTNFKEYIFNKNNLKKGNFSKDIIY